MLEYFLSPAKADLLPTNGGSSARSDPPGYGPVVVVVNATVELNGVYVKPTNNV